MNLSEIIENSPPSPLEESGLLYILAVGCKIHPPYRAKRKVITNCERCNEIWAARQELRKWHLIS